MSESPFILEEIEDFISRGWSQRKIAKYYDRAVSTLNVWLNRERKKKAREMKKRVYTNSQIVYTKPESVYTNSSNAKIVKPSNDQTDDHLLLEQIMLTKYGELDPTLYHSELNHDEWAEHYAGYYWDRDYLTELREAVWTIITLMILIPRGHGKTWSVIALVVRHILEVRTPVLVVTSSKTGLAGDIYRGVYQLLISPKIRRDYGDVIQGKPGFEIVCHPLLRTKKDGTVMIQPNFKVQGGVNTAAAGKRPGWLILDDIVQEVSVGTEPERRIRRWLDSTLLPMLKRGDENYSRLTIIGTRQDPDDIYGYMIEENHIRPHHLPAIKGALELYPTKEEVEADHPAFKLTSFPERCNQLVTLNCPDKPLSYLLYMYLFKYRIFESQYQNNPLPDRGNFFSVDNWIEEPLIKARAYANYIVCDPSFGGSDTSSSTAILVLAVFNGMLFIRDAYIGQTSFTKIEDKILEFYDRYDPLATYLEDNFNQISRSFTRDTRLQKLPGLRLLHSKLPKKDRIAALDYPYDAHFIVIDEFCKFKQEIKKEYLTFHLELSTSDLRTKYNSLDALSIGYLKLRNYLISSERDIQKSSVAWGKI